MESNYRVCSSNAGHAMQTVTQLFIQSLSGHCQLMLAILKAILSLCIWFHVISVETNWPGS